MVSLKQTEKKYHGKKAETYDEIRTKQARWAVEDSAVGQWIDIIKPKKVLDCPVGTGRFLEMYSKQGVASATGLDISKEMLELARKKIGKKFKGDLQLVQGSATYTDASDKTYDCVVCVRFLDLIDEDAMVKVVTELTRVAKKHVICTIRLADTYTPKSNTAEHDRAKFEALVKKRGFVIRDKVLFREGTWNILLLERIK